MGDAAGVPELQVSGVRSVHPGIWLSTYDVPYPLIPREYQPAEDCTSSRTGEDCSRSGTREDKVRSVVSKMKAMEVRIADLRDTTASLFGKTFLATYGRSGDSTPVSSSLNQADD